MAKKKKRVLSWLRLDNSAKIYPAARRRNWSNVFRQSVTLGEEIDVDVLRSALAVTVKRFPSIAARLRRGLFWYYLQQLDTPPEIRQEQSYPLVYMSGREMRTCALRVLVYGRRIAVEFFHSLTDGNGALVFLKTLTAEYLERKHGIRIPCECGILDRTESPSEEELEDSNLKYAGPVPVSRKASTAWHLTGEARPDGFLHLTCFRLPVDRAMEIARENKVTVTVLLTAVLMKALLNMQKDRVPSVFRRKPVKVLIPVNLRSLFPSKSLRNFVLYTTPELDPRLGDYTLKEIFRVIQSKMGEEVTPKFMSKLIATNVNDERNPFVRLVPLPIKNLVMKAIFDSVGERKSCLTLSNLGLVKLPEEMRPYVERMDFILGVQAAAPYNCGMLSYGDTVYVNFIRNIRDAELERHFYAVLREIGLSAVVESNQSGEE